MFSTTASSWAKTSSTNLGRIQAQGLLYWADPGHDNREVNTHDGGRGVYFDDPSGHQLEIITRPHGEARGQVAVLANPKAGGRPTLR